MNSKRLRILCESNPMCYGSTTALLAVIEKSDAHITCLSNGVTTELLGRHPKIDVLIEVDTKNTAEVAVQLAVLAFDCVFVVSNTANLAYYHLRGIPVYFLHLHYFYPGLQTAYQHYIHKLFVQKFWNLHTPPAGAETVGPCISDLPRKRAGKIVLVNLGGGESQWIKPGENSDYSTIILELILQVRSFLPAQQVVIAGGQKSIRQIKQTAAAAGITADSFTSAQYLELLADAECLLTAPGLNAFFEALFMQVPLLFLPPQNTSQVIQLQCYESAGLVCEGLNLDCFDPGFRLAGTDFKEAEQTARVIRALRKISGKENRETLAAHLVQQLSEIKTKTHQQRLQNARLFLGSAGADTIAQTLMQIHPRNI